MAAATQRGPPTGKPIIATAWRAAQRALTQPDDEPEPDEPKKRREDGDGEFQKLMARFARHLKARKLEQFRKVAAKRLRFVRTIQLSREEWGAPDAHLQTTLNLFDQPDSRAPSTVRSSHAVRSHSHVSGNRRSLGL